MRCLALIGACLAIGGQATLTLATLAEARSTDIGAHVEAGGTSIHYVHDETCAICQARLLQVAATRLPEIPSDTYRCAPTVSTVDLPIVLDRRSPISSRAPPRVS